jgi:hypothetical protein
MCMCYGIHAPRTARSTMLEKPQSRNVTRPVRRPSSIVLVRPKSKISESSGFQTVRFSLSPRTFGEFLPLRGPRSGPMTCPRSRVHHAVATALARGAAPQEPARAPQSSRGRLCGHPPHTTGRALLYPAVRQRIDRAAALRLPASGIPSPSARKGSALWPNPSSFTAFAQPVVAPSGAFCLHRLSHEPLKFLPSSTFGPSRHFRADTMTSADSCRLNPTSRLELPSENRVAAGLPR